MKVGEKETGGMSNQIENTSIFPGRKKIFLFLSVMGSLYFLQQCVCVSVFMCVFRIGETKSTTVLLSCHKRLSVFVCVKKCVN